jgi:peptidoglycan hydrolase-like protein with peptidoglycan-binding domain
VYKNTAARKSLTVHHLQRRLAELGYNEAMTDKDGWLGDETKTAIEKFQKDKGFEPNGMIDEATFIAIFKGDMNVVPIV